MASVGEKEVRRHLQALRHTRDRRKRSLLWNMILTVASVELDQLEEKNRNAGNQGHKPGVIDKRSRE